MISIFAIFIRYLFHLIQVYQQDMEKTFRLLEIKALIEIFFRGYAVFLEFNSL